MDKIYIGVDVGAKGYFTVIYPSNYIHHQPIIDTDKLDIIRFLQTIKNDENIPIVCCMEEVHAIYGSSAKGTFSFGEIFGYLQGVVFALGIPLTLVPPKTWQSEIWTTTDKVYKEGKKIDTKATSLNAARRLFPTLSFKRTERCSKPDDNLVDSLLIAEYARRKNL